MFGNLSYTSKDITSIREEIIEFIKENNPDWADFNESSIQMQYTEMLAGVADMLCYYLDAQALETFLTSAKQKKNINSILKMINYNFDVIGSAMGSVTFTRTLHDFDKEGKPIYSDVRYYIPRFLDLWTEDRTHFLTSSEVSMPEDKLEINVPVIQGTVIKKNFPLDTVKQSFKLQVTAEEVPLEYVEIVNSGYEKVEDAFLLTKGGPYYSVHYDSYNNVFILFTFDYRKYLPESGDLVVSYVQSLGDKGNVGSETIIDYGEGIYSDVNVDKIELKVSNPSAMYGGFSDTDYKKHQANARNWLLCHDTIVLMSDFETMVRKEPWVLDCACFDWRKDDTIVTRPYQLKAWIVSPQGPELSDNEMTLLQYRLQQKTVIMNTVEILNAEFIPLTVEVKITVQGNSENNKENIRKSVEDQLKKWYLWDDYKTSQRDSRLVFGIKIDTTKLTYEIAGMASAISNIEIYLTVKDEEPTSENVYLSKTEFLYCTAIRVRLVEDD